MKKYLSFFRLRFLMNLQYRTAAWAGIATQFVWGGLEISVFGAFYKTQPEQFPMTFQATVNYIWLQQAFLALFAAWILENEIFESIRDGNIAYEMCRPLHIYPMLFARGLAVRVSRAVLRCFRVSAPESAEALCLFFITMILGALVTVAFGTLIYVSAFFTISAQGLRLMVTCVMDFFNGAIIPLPFFPDKVRAVMELLPFAAMQNVPLRVYSGDLAGREALRAATLQIFWLFVLAGAGQLLMKRAEQKVRIQGG